MIIFNKVYFISAVLIFAIEVLIALFVHDKFVRPYGGDILVIILLYCLIMSFFRLSVLTVAMTVLIFAFLVEFLQCLNIVEKLGLEKSSVAGIIIGSSFAWLDLLAYIVGGVIVVIFEKFFVLKNKPGN